VKVSKLMEQLKAYDPNEEILVVYWDKYCADSYVSMAGDREEITPEQWAKVLEEIDNDNALDYDLHSIGEIITAKVEEVVPIGSEGATR
jgi:hypothetical protein